MILSIFLLAAGCSDPSTGSNSAIPHNPYPEGSGHYAGYKWADETGGGCSSASTSFNEGCAEFWRQTATRANP